MFFLSAGLRVGHHRGDVPGHGPCVGRVDVPKRDVPSAAELRGADGLSDCRVFADWLRKRLLGSSVGERHGS